MFHSNDDKEKMAADSKRNRDWLYNLYEQGYSILVTRNFEHDDEEVYELKEKRNLDNPLTWVPGETYSILNLIDFLKRNNDFLTTGCNNFGFWAIEEWDGYESCSYGRVAFAFVKGEVYIE